MGKRPICPGLHDWEEVGAKFKCKNCSATFPCRAACTHVDCEDIKGPPKCEKCRKPVDWENRMYTLKGIYHLECIT